MASNYEQITADNIRDWGEKSARIGDFFASELYSDRTHFVYELIQNAEDALARRTEAAPEDEFPRRLALSLFPDRLEVRHFGVLFSEADVRGVCGILEGTKADEEQQIGRFGIGFKSVYAVTASPEVHSGEEHFCIREYIRPAGVDPKPTEAGETLFVIPFDRRPDHQGDVFELVAHRLRQLGMRTLLFLRHISEIQWQIGDAEWGSYRKETKAGSDWRIVDLIDDATQRREERWVTFERSVTVPGVARSGKVEVAFHQTRNERDGKRRFEPVTPSPLFAYFPTEKDTRLGFVIQGPYNTTPARDNIRQDDTWNSALVEETAALAVSALKRFKRKERLGVDLLLTIPLSRADFEGDRAIFRPIFTTIRDALKAQELIPTDDGQYAPADASRIPHSDRLRKLLRPKQLQSLYGSSVPLHWVPAEISRDRTPQLVDYFKQELGIAELETDGVTYKLSEGFLRQQSDEWMIGLYHFLSEIPSLWRRPGGIGSVPIIRLESGRHVAPFAKEDTPNAYLPTDAVLDYPTVKRALVGDKTALSFLQQLGLRQPSVCDEVIERILPKYEGTSLKEPPDDEYESDLKKIMAALSTDSSATRKRIIEIAQKRPIFRARKHSDGRESLRPGETVYYPSDELSLYFEGNPEPWFLDVAPEIMDQKDALADLGITGRPRPIIHFSTLTPQEKAKLREGSRSTEDLVDADYDLDGLECFLNTLPHHDRDGRIARASLLWGYLRGLEKVLSGVYYWQYYSKKEAHFDSRMLKRLKSAAWLPTSDGELHAPPDLDPNELPKDFQHDRSLIVALGVGSKSEARKAVLHVKEQYAAALGVSVDDVETIKKHPEAFRKWRQSIARAEDRPAFPVKPVVNAERRAIQLRELVAQAPRKEFAVRVGSVRVSQPTEDPKRWLRAQYGDEGPMVCQICTKTMPFKGRDGEYYFEATQILDDLAIEDAALYLALCPVCHAKYREFVKQVKSQADHLRDAILGCDGLSVPVALDGGAKRSVHFTEQHLHDVKVILSELRSQPR